MAANFWAETVRRVRKKYRVIYKRGPSRLAMMFAGVALASTLGFLFLTGYPVVQYVYYTLRPATSARLAQVLQEARAQDAQAAEQVVVQPEEPLEPSFLPELDASLPGGQYLFIPKIGVDTVVWEGATEDYESVLRRGVWRAPELPRPVEGKPTILVAHRFGYLEWTNEYRRKNSFFNLPKLEIGDKIEVVWDQRRFEYQVAAKEEAEQITDWSHDLILYTCKYLVSPTRIIVYADRLN